ncbi:hypothetical protein AGABI1DRAFT_110389 [Agaricus bisporus var. burnettii JB137-S8]|uniref:Phytocyanin domain-containing protein n=1 Tax=Agaricus bisporus var. burnettii (strain JB137-S8 / ATCC MYA-4627 / FGSC 10392) TaxID=597362 RepID=K5XJS1_AGABU|nr:uncharacterized protein AGABI1DRAFT_110389 [Agaricus bisporus var. burnettii JB137-S8]EKM83773.1 hypothetical protein AGABI1DRAFT_110389 [Agaricus bisporus var. burnettii JB137-S8]
MFALPLSLGLALLPFASAAVHDIQVGAEGKLQFWPEAIAAQPGDQVVFHFASKNHTATQSSFADPCGHSEGGFDSGFMPVAANQTDSLPTFAFTVEDTKAVWVYCKQKVPVGHCGKGMVFSVNCPPDGDPNSFTNFKKSALAIGAAEASATPPAAPSADSGSAPAGYGGYGGGYGDSGAPAPSSSDPAPAAPASASTSALGAVHTVIVGESGSLAFNPPSIQAKPSDTVIFEFRDKNHTVTQSSFADPCTKGASGFDSGFMPVANPAGPFPTWKLTVNDTTPIWAYCRQQVPKSHCGTGMVFAINAVEDGPKNFTAFQNVAKALSGGASAGSAVSGDSNTADTNSALSIHLSPVTVTAMVSVAVALLL